ncbi:hypothetical protein [Botrimarina mediterranea]|uniref:hypothetical protein n=1 Tax=Botrimarina mediterranea TaxID=2528022 RepID=UPI001188955B|nr:hypothetical protein K2D_16390 [Planctomycetes bacterium K2D]
MKTYWDHTEKERANLTREQVEKLCKFELMGEGVIVTMHPGEPPAKPEISEPKVTVHGVIFKGSSYHTLDVWFRTKEEAVAFAALKPVRVDSDYRLGDKYEAIDAYESQSFVEKEVFNVVDGDAFNAATKQYAAEKESYDRSLAKWKEDNDSARKCCESLWDDYAEQREKLSNAQSVLSRWNEYVESCDGDKEIAARFLRKAYTQSQIELANDWCDASIPMLPQCVEA